MENKKIPSLLFPSDEEMERKLGIEELVQTLELDKSLDGRKLCLYSGFWTRTRYLKSMMRFHEFFKANDTDIILASMPKCGTTWLKALTYTISNRKLYSVDSSPLLTLNPHACVPFLDFEIYANDDNPDLDSIPSPRLFAVHMPYASVPSSVRDNKCRIIYICRNPLDFFISHWHFIHAMIDDTCTGQLSMEESFDKFCSGIHPYGPFWDHVLGYWNAHLDNPEKVLFLKYEDMMEDVVSHIKKIADFVGLPLSEEEEKQGVAEQIANLCSFGNLKNLEVNKTGKHIELIENRVFFRKGEVGDWSNYLTSEMARRYQNILRQKLDGTGLDFTFSIESHISNLYSSHIMNVRSP